MSRSSLQSLKSETDEKNRMYSIEIFTKILYDTIIKQATTSIDCVYRFEIGVFHPGVTSAFIHNNKQDILSSLQKVFPDSLVEYKTFKKIYVPYQQPIFYDISSVDQHLLGSMTGHTIVDCIVIDWS
jgi:hypothetical protein